MYVIDGMNGVEACYHFAGIVAIHPKGLTLRQLWRMAVGKIQQKRIEILELANMVWGADGIDTEAYLFHGKMIPTGKGGPVQMSPELEAKVAAEVKRMRAENPSLPRAPGEKI